MLSSFFFVIILISISAEQPSRTPLPNCSSLSNCGNMSIGYPFHVGSNCSNNNDNFTIYCNSTSGNPKPFLTNFNLEVLAFPQSLTDINTVTVKIPVVDTCATQDDRRTSLDLTGTPFFIDTTNNVFASIGCDGYASLYNEKGDMVRRCSSTCRIPNEQERLDGCYNNFSNYYCCQSDLRSIRSLQNYSLEAVGGGENGSCRSVFLTSRLFLASNVSLTMAITEFAVPIVLSWSGETYSPVNYASWAGGIALFISIPCTVLSSCCFWWCWLYKTRKKRKEVKLRTKYFKKKLREQRSSRNIELLEKTKLFSTKYLKEATNHFNIDRILGEGGQGTVYKGMLTNGLIVAVKKLKGFDDSHWMEFINEVIILSQVTHRNVVKLFGCCLEGKEPLLVYEFVSNGTLSQHIHDAIKKSLITWNIRVRIACESAGAISYLHSSMSFPIYHRDIKSTNILLDHEYLAKVTDFGISKVIGEDQTHLTTCVRGTFGYLDPEYFESSQYTQKSDVYSFGVILVELLTGQKPIRPTIVDEERSLVDYFLLQKSSSNLDEILDPMVFQGSSKDEVMVMADISERCLNPQGIERPTMQEVAMQLEGLRKTTYVKPVIHCSSSFEIESVITESSKPMDVASTSEIRNMNVEYEISEDELPLFNKTW